MAKPDRCVVRNEAYRKAGLNVRERHNERKNENYYNSDILPERSHLNVYFKTCESTYTETFDNLLADDIISIRGLQKDAKVVDEMIFDVNTEYFERNGGYDFAKSFFEEAYRLAVKEAGGEEYILSAVMHADERNKAVSEKLGRDVYHYHLHVMYIPIVDDEAADIVRRIFRLSVDGHGPAQIARMMNAEHRLNPSSYKHENGILSKPRPCKDPYFWNTTTVHKILDSQEYLGHTVNFKTYSKSYKDTKSRMNPPEKQMIFENTHPAIIGEETWEIVRKMREHKRRTPRYGNPGLFSGVVYCSDCGSKLYYHTREIQNKAKTKSRYDGAYSFMRIT